VAGPSGRPPLFHRGRTPPRAQGGPLAHPRFRLAVLLLAVASVAAGLAMAAPKPGARPQAVTPISPSVQLPARPRHPAPVVHKRQASNQRPNIVFVLTDDLSMNLLRFMPHVLDMERHGLTFSDYFVSDSLCCPSRASIFTGNFPHDTKVLSNGGLHGGFREFFERGEEQHTFAVALHQAGYRTAMMGKYLNGYLQQEGETKDGAPAAVPPTHIPPGWSTWDVAGFGYPNFNYLLNENGTLQYYGHKPQDYLTDVIARHGVDFINSSAAAGSPFFLELASFAPHRPYTPAPRDAHSFPGLTVPRLPNFNVLPRHAPRWLAHHPKLTAGQISRIDKVYRRRAQSVQAVDDMIGQVEKTLAADGLSRNTYLVFSSDNGLHAGEYRLMPGKLTAFDTDIRVPLVVIGPGVPQGAKTTDMAENIDLAKTFAQIGGTDMPGDGHSLLPLWRGENPADWRTAVLIEHRGPRTAISDPDFQQASSGNPTTYEAMRTHNFLYVEYDDGERELYDLRTDPFELRNIAYRVSPIELYQLHLDLLAMKQCHDGAACWQAMHVGSVAAALHRRHAHRRRRRP
jgi:N-acetylglucosamine-6-sulfatase